MVLSRLYEGRPYLALQLSVVGDDGEFAPVRWKSCTVRVRELAEVIAALKQAEKTLTPSKSTASPGRPGPKGNAAKVESAPLFDGGRSAAPSSAGSECIQPDGDDMPF